MQLRRLIAGFNIENFQRNHVVYNQDDNSSYVYIVYSGTFEISRKQVVTAEKKTLEVSDFLGPSS